MPSLCFQSLLASAISIQRAHDASLQNVSVRKLQMAIAMRRSQVPNLFLNYHKHEEFKRTNLHINTSAYFLYCTYIEVIFRYNILEIYGDNTVTSKQMPKSFLLPEGNSIIERLHSPFRFSFCLPLSWLITTTTIQLCLLLRLFQLKVERPPSTSMMLSPKHARLPKSLSNKSHRKTALPSPRPLRHTQVKSITAFKHCAISSSFSLHQLARNVIMMIKKISITIRKADTATTASRNAVTMATRAADVSSVTLARPLLTLVIDGGNSRPRYGLGSEERQSASYGAAMSGEPVVQEEFLVPNHMVGLVIGKGGENLKKIENMSGTRLQFAPGIKMKSRRKKKVEFMRSDHPKNVDMGEQERRLDMSGEADQVKIARNMVQQVIDDARSNESARFSGGSRTTDYAAMAASRAGSGSQMTIPSSKVGLLIGRGGETIRDLEDRSGAKITIAPEAPGERGHERTVSLIGNDGSVDRARRMIEDLLGDQGYSGSVR